MLTCFSSELFDAEPQLLRYHEPRQSYSNVLMFYSTYNKTEYSRPLFVQKYLKRLQLAFVSHSAIYKTKHSTLSIQDLQKKNENTRKEKLFFFSLAFLFSFPEKHIFTYMSICMYSHTFYCMVTGGGAKTRVLLCYCY